MGKNTEVRKRKIREWRKKLKFFLIFISSSLELVTGEKNTLQFLYTDFINPDIDIGFKGLDHAISDVFQIYPNAIHFNPLQFCPSMSLLGFLSSSMSFESLF